MAGAGEPVSASALLDYTSAGTSLVAAYRTHGHLAARLDPLGTPAPDDPALHPEYHGLTEEAMRAIPARALRVYVDGETLWDVLPHLREIYCGTVAYEIEHLSSHEQRRWLREAIESRRFWVPTQVEEKRRLLIRLLRVEGLEQYLRRTFLGAKTFSIEGLDMMILMLDEAVLLAAEEGIEEAVFGMAHRGRLNVLAHVLRRPYRDIFAEFEGEHALDVETLRPDHGSGDVKYHHAANTTRTFEVGGETRSIRLSLVPNPSHLEFVNPVVMGRTRALETVYAAPASVTHDRRRALSVLIHGDSAFSGQGIVAESLNLGTLPGYTVGGALHLIAQQPDRLHDRSARLPLDAPLVRPGEGLQRPDHPRQRRPPGRLPRRRPARDGVPGPVRARRADRPRRLPPLGPQRGRRARLHASQDVRGRAHPPADRRAATPRRSSRRA